MTSRKDLLDLFSSSTGRTTISPRPQDPRVENLAGFMTSYANESRVGRVPVPTFRQGGFEGVDVRRVQQLEGLEMRRVMGGRMP